MDKVTILIQEDSIGLDRKNLEALYLQLGPIGAENVVCRAMEELAVRMTELGGLYRDGRLDELAKRARSLVGIAEQIGLTTLARVAGDVTACAGIGDAPSLAATLCRLERVGDRSLTAVWDLRDLSV